VRAPLPGAILDVRVAPGQKVEEGQVLFLLEAMKMENEVVAPIAGVVQEVRVAAGQTVELGELLCLVEAS
jgi:biotin carboxyl carrier protein